MIAPARVAAFDALTAVSAGTADLSSVIAQARSTLTDERDRALVTEIVTGVQRWRGTLDHLIAHFSKRGLDRLDPPVVDILRLGMYQLLHLTRVPAAAVVDDAVKLTGRAGKRSAAGFVNAILRTVSRKRSTLPLPARPADVADRDRALDYLSITLSHPRWLAARWYDRFGFEAAESWMTFNNEPAPISLRANRLRTTRADLAARLGALGISTAPGRFAPDALIVQDGNPLRLSEHEHGGGFVVQDEASQLVVLLAGEAPGPRVLDTCASPGGKTSAFAALIPPGGRLIACDVRDRRMRLLRKGLMAAGATGVRLVQADLLAPLPFLAPFDTVVVDAPCSGLGTLRRDPDIRWRRRETDLPRLAEAQRRMLGHAADAVATGGRLVYATCSSEPEENEAVAQAFLEQSPDFVPIDAGQVQPQLPPAVIDARGHLRTAPHLHRLDAFFGAVFERRRAL